MLEKLKTWKGYTVDKRLNEFRKVNYNKKSKLIIEFVPFNSTKGKKLLLKYNKQIGRKRLVIKV